MDMKRVSKRTTVLLVVVAAAVMAAVGAYAYWTSSGTGQGTATTGTDTPWIVTTDAETTTDTLTPGGPVEEISYHVQNGSTGHQALFNVNVQIANTDNSDPTSTPSAWSEQDDSLKPACTASDFELSVDGANWAAAGAAIDDSEAAGDVDSLGTKDGSFFIRMVNKTPTATPANNQDNCKSVDVPLFLVAS